MIKFIHVTFFLFFIIQGIDAQNHLEPSKGLLGMYDSEYEYESQVRDILLKGLPRTPDVQVIIFPPFGNSEEVFQLNHDRDKETFTLISQIVSKSITGNKDEGLSEMKLYKKEKLLSKESFELIKELYKTAIYTVRYPDENFLTLDGVTYHISIKDYGVKTGQTWSPVEGSKMGRLVAITFKLIDLIDSSRTTAKISSELSSEIKELTEELQ